MTRRRWIADEVKGDTAALIGEHALHLSRVLRARIGQEFDVVTPAGVRVGTVVAISDSRIEFALGYVQAVEVAPSVFLALAIFKFDRMEWAIEKCTEIGVAGIIPVIARRTDTHLAAAAIKRHDRWLRIGQQASEQSRRTSPPEIAVPVKLKDLVATSSSRSISEPSVERLAEPPADCARIVLAENESDVRLRDALQSRPSEVLLAVGPAGGWTDDELQLFTNSGWIRASFGETILRAETAAIVAAAFAMDSLR